MSPKPPHANVVRNPWGPGMYADRLAIGLTLTEGSGTSYGNVGKRTSAPWDAPAGVNTPTWGADRNGTANSAVSLVSGSSQRIALATMSSDTSFERGTLCVGFIYTAGGGTRAVFGSGSTSGTGNQVRALITPASGIMDVTHFASTNSIIRFSGLAIDTWYTLFMSWGELGFSSRLFSPAGEIVGETQAGTPSADTAPLTISNGQTFTLGANGALTHTTGRIDVFAWYDWQLPSRAIEQLAYDPALFMRPIPTVTERNNVMVGRVTDAAATMGFVTHASLTGTAYLRVLVGPDLETMIVSPDTGFTANTTDANAALEGSLADLGGTARYWAAQWSTDGTTYYDMSGGMGYFAIQKEAGTAYEAAYVSDEHVNSITTGETTVPDGYFTDTSKGWLRISACLEDIFLDPPDFTILGGDGVFLSSSDSTDTDRTRWIKYMNMLNPIFTSGGAYFMLGNHEREIGFLQDASSATTTGNQRDCTVLRKKFFINPTNTTYSEGGENDTNYLDNAGSDWVPALDGTFDATYRTNQIGDGTDGNAPPLENYYAFTWGDCLWIVLDPFRYTKPGGSNTITDEAHWILGETQWAWLEGVLAASTARHKVICIHQQLGGVRQSLGPAGWYGRGSGAQISNSRLSSVAFTSHEVATGTGAGSPGIIDELRLHSLCRQYSVNAVVKGHDHQFIHVRKNTVNYVSAPALSITKFSSTDAQKEIFGSPDIEYADRAADGVLFGHAGSGYMRLSVSASSLNLTYRLTYVSNNGAADTEDNVWDTVRNVGPTLTGTDGSVTLTETPRNVLCVCTEEDGTWTLDTQADIEDNFAASNLYTTPFSGVGVTAYLEPYASATIAYDDSALAAGSQSIKVDYAPRDLYTTTLTGAVPDPNVSEYLMSGASRGSRP